MFPGSRFATPYFVEYGQDGRASVDNADRYVYALSNDGFWDNGNNLILGRVARSKIGNLSATDWQYYQGGDGMEDSAWMSDMARAKLVLDAPGKLGMNGAVYVPGLRRYIMIGWYYPAGGGKIKDACHATNWDFYEAPKPWGPWTKSFDVRIQPARLLLAAALSEVHERRRPPLVRDDRGRLEPAEVLSVDHRSPARGRQIISRLCTILPTRPPAPVRLVAPIARRQGPARSFIVYR